MMAGECAWQRYLFANITDYRKFWQLRRSVMTQQYLDVDSGHVLSVGEQRP